MSAIKNLSLSLLLSFSLVPAAKAEELPQVIRFAEVGLPGQGKVNGIGLAPLAAQQGFFDREFGKGGPKIEITYYIGTGPAINEAIAENQADFGTYGGLPALIGRSGGVPAHVVLARRSAALASSYVFAVHPDSRIKTIADLKGARIAIQKGTVPYMALVQVLEAAHLSEGDVTIVNLQGPAALAAFEAGSADALFSTSFILLLEKRTAVRLIHAPKISVVRQTSLTAILANSAFEQRYPQTVARIVKVLVDISHWASQDANRDVVLTYLASAGYGTDIAKEIYSGSLKEEFDPIVDNDVKDGFRQTSQFAVTHNMVRQAPNLDGWFEPKYVDTAVKDLHLQGYWEKQP
ncbi:MAG: ABC transporter substrate-binding protein [Pseudomonadota bacterium]